MEIGSEEGFRSYIRRSGEVVRERRKYSCKESLDYEFIRVYAFFDVFVKFFFLRWERF